MGIASLFLGFWDDFRKTLAQGRLVTNLTATGFTTQKDDKQFGEEAFAADQDLGEQLWINSRYY